MNAATEIFQRDDNNTNIERKKKGLCEEWFY